MTAATVSPRERLLAAADELFYGEGVHTVGIDRVIARAGVAKATLYSTFGSKDGLIAAYLESRHDSMRERMSAAIAAHRTPRRRLLAPFDIQAGFAADPGYRGCAFANATAETHGPDADAALMAYRGWIHATFAQLAREAGARDPEPLATRLQLLWDGAGVSARTEHDPAKVRVATDVAAALLDGALDPGRSRS